MAQSSGQGSPLPGEELHNSELPENPANFDNQVGKNEIAETLGAGITLDSGDRIDDLDSEQSGADRGFESVESDAVEPGKAADSVRVNLPHVANKSTTKAAEDLPHVAEKPLPKNVLKFTTRGKSKHRKPRAKSTTKLATRGKSEKPPKVEDVKASKGTWAFRLRWNSLPGRPVIYVSRVADSTYELIKKGNYDAFKEQLISSYGESAFRASNQA